MYILGINPGSHESSACLLADNRIIAMAEEERFTRVKHAMNQMPCYAIQYCLKKGGIELADVDYIASCWNPDSLENTVHFCTPQDIERRSDYWKRIFPATHFNVQALPPVVQISHHLAHAAAVYRTSQAKEGALLVVDGQGDTVSTTIAHCANQCIQILTQYPISQSLGYFYQALTSFLGFGWLGNEGKTMGLAAYGHANYDFPEITLTNNGYKIAAPAPLHYDAAPEMIEFWHTQFEKHFHAPRVAHSCYDLSVGRLQKSLEPDAFARNLAASAQAKLEQVLIHLAQQALQDCHSTTLLLSGGVALNCSANEKLLRETSAEEIVLFPAGGDAGAAVGAALELAHHLGICSKADFTPFLGPEFADASIASMLEEYGIPYTQSDDPARVAMERLCDQQIVGWFQGRMEVGPRALGHRSILANPSSTVMRDQVNFLAKRREWWRPLAPILRQEDTYAVLGEDLSSPYMLRAISVAQAAQERIPATIHVDGSARLQTVTEQSDFLLHQLLSDFTQCSGISAILNTSFNDENEPIVCSPHDAIKTFFSTGIDVLVMNNFIVDLKGRRQRG